MDETNETSTRDDAEARRLANLKPFPKGVSGNPKGRPRDVMTQALRRVAAEIDPDDPEGRTYAETLAAQIFVKAKGGDVRAFKEITDRIEGRAKQTVTVSVERRDQLEKAIEGMMRDAEAAGIPCSREDAINTLSLLVPEAGGLDT